MPHTKGPLRAVDTLAKAAPALGTTSVLVLARVWNAHGAQHSVGGALLMGALTVGATVAGCASAHGHGGTNPAITGAAFATAGALTLAGVSGYADGLALPLLLWAIATAIAYGLAARHWSAERREHAAYERDAARRRAEHAHRERVAAIHAGARIETARLQLEAVRTSAVHATALADALAARAALPGHEAAEVVRLDPRGLPGEAAHRPDVA